MNKKLLLIGGGGHCKSVIDSINKKDYDTISIVDPNLNVGFKINGIEIVGNDDNLLDLYNKGFKYAFITIGGIGLGKKRESLYIKLHNIGFKFPSIIDSSALISNISNIGEGSYIGKNTVINSDSKIGKFTIINTSSTIEHDCTLSDFVHISPGVIVSGNVKIDLYTHVGTNSTLINNINIGSNTIIGIGSVVTKSIPSNVIAYGNPCKVIWLKRLI